METIWVVEKKSNVGYGRTNTEQTFYRNKPSIEDLTHDVLGVGKHTEEEIEKVKELYEEGHLYYRVKKFRVKEITLIKN